MAMSAHVRRLRAAMGTELLVLPSVTGIIFDDENRILLVRQTESGLWSAPGGAVDPEEQPADAVVREVWEETGLHTKPQRLLGVYGGPPCLVTYPNGDRTTYVMTVFECTVLGGTLRERSDETSAAAFVAASELDSYETSGWVRHIVPGLYDRSRSAYFEAPSWQPPRTGA
jgi:ADP-ribose pyrophosphatase YjhB (NUDIX family)